MQTWSQNSVVVRPNIRMREMADLSCFDCEMVFVPYVVVAVCWKWLISFSHTTFSKTAVGNTSVSAFPCYWERAEENSETSSNWQKSRISQIPIFAVVVYKRGSQIPQHFWTLKMTGGSRKKSSQVPFLTPKITKMMGARSLKLVNWWLDMDCVNRFG